MGFKADPSTASAAQALVAAERSRGLRAQYSTSSDGGGIKAVPPASGGSRAGAVGAGGSSSALDSAWTSLGAVRGSPVKIDPLRSTPGACQPPCMCWGLFVPSRTIHYLRKAPAARDAAAAAPTGPPACSFPTPVPQHPAAAGRGGRTATWTAGQPRRAPPATSSAPSRCRSCATPWWWLPRARRERSRARRLPSRGACCAAVVHRRAPRVPTDERLLVSAMSCAAAQLLLLRCPHKPCAHRPAAALPRS